MILFVKDAPPTTATNAKLQGRRDETESLARRELVLSAQSSPFLPDNVTKLAGETHEEFWQKHVCRGEKLAQACARDKDTAINFVIPIDSEFDGTMETEMETWGYKDYNGKSLYCELNNIASTLNSIGVDAVFRKKNTPNGQNECYHIEHNRADGKYEVDGKAYRTTGAYAHIGVNARDGVVSFMNVRSADTAAISNWQVAQPADAEMPRLRKISDITWAFWRRAHADGAGLSNINKFLVHDIINSQTIRLMQMALQRYEVPEGQERLKRIPKWPGLELGIETPGALAMLGSPNGLAVGYFLAQHKTQLGGNKHVHKVTIWKDDEGDEQMLFWVKDAPPPPVDDPWTTSDSKGLMDTFNKADNVVKRSVDGRNIIREHRILAKL
ncbi:hypothetical protein C7974DRAFT_387722 [Boeremia exigua]|uniref:uncharacterized protein n=1 Tax=Boeremia exigua TaxID=749465 RepID=UPI001E8D362D|nr:uncharacterized protein C7974DRAFT_387722 [Boeremia exigua]KAH6639025.1 hypothetical protein C7974DRAFT_387722 [Boeremia exigua]